MEESPKVEFDMQDLRDVPFLLSPTRNVRKTLSRLELYKMTKGVHGDIVECGVYKGQSVLLFSHLLQIFEPVTNKLVVGFDTFAGHSSVSEKDGSENEKAKEGYLATSFEKTKAIIDHGGVGHRVRFVKGDAVETIPNYINYHERQISLLIIDFDIYSPCKVALDHLLPYVVKGGIVAFDDLNCVPYPGANHALQEYYEGKLPQLRQFEYDPWIGYFVKE